MCCWCWNQINGRSDDHTGQRFKAEFYSKEKIQTNIQQTGSGTYMGCNWVGSSCLDQSDFPQKRRIHLIPNRHQVVCYPLKVLQQWNKLFLFEIPVIRMHCLLLTIFASALQTHAWPKFDSLRSRVQENMVSLTEKARAHDTFVR